MTENTNPSIIRSVSIPLLLYQVAKDYGISPSEALKEGIVLMLSNREKFPKDDYEKFLIYECGELQKFKTDIINKTTNIIQGSNNGVI